MARLLQHTTHVDNQLLCTPYAQVEMEDEDIKMFGGHLQYAEIKKR